MNTTKKSWSTPRLKVYGDIEEITRSSNATNADTPAGVPNTAFPVGS